MESIGIKSAKLFRQQAFIGGKWLTAANNRTYPILNPATQQVNANIPDMAEQETEIAISAAYEAFKTWRHTTARERSVILRKWFTLMQDHSEDLARILTAETGKPLSEAKGELAYGSSFLEWYSEEAKRIYGEIPSSPSTSKEMLFIRQPIGVAAMITPWNFPNAMITRKAGAALAAGCTCVVKPAEDTPLSALAAAALAQEAGIPDGVFNVVTGSKGNASAIGSTLCASPKVAMMSFTGSVNVGKLLYKQCAATVKRLGLELGGNAPFIVFDSADLNVAIESLMVAKFRNSGQACISANRVFVQSGIYKKFVHVLKDTVSKRLKVGNGFEEGVNIGPLINQSQLQKVDRIVKESIEQGAQLVLGGKTHSLGGFFYEPTILTGCEPNMSCFSEEIFGPVVSIKMFKTEKEVVELANDVDVGLAGYLFSRDVSQVFRVSRQLETGMVGVNEGLISTAEAAFGGVKESGIGREGSRHGIEDYTELKYICIGGIDNEDALSSDSKNSGFVDPTSDSPNSIWLVLEGPPSKY